MLAFVEEQVSTNIFIRAICNASYMRRINRYRQQLKIAFDKFNVRLRPLAHINLHPMINSQIQSGITTNRLLLQVLQEQDQLSDKIQHGNGIKKVAAKRVAHGKPRPKTKKGETKSIQPSHSEQSGSEKTKATRVSEKITRKEQYLYSDGLSEDEWSWEDDEILPSTSFKNKGSTIHNFVLPSTTIYDWPETMNQSHDTATWSPPSITFSGSGKGMIINNRGNGNVPYLCKCSE